MAERKRATLIVVIMAAAMAAGLAIGNPSALADPEVPPPAPNDPAAVAAPPPDLYAPPAVDAQTSPPADPVFLPTPFTAPPADPLTALPPTVIPEDTRAGQNPAPYIGQPVFAPPSFNPSNGAMVGVAKPIIINFVRPIADRPMAEQAIHISSVPPVPGKFYWMSNTQVRWRPIDFWPANTIVNIDASGTKSSFPHW